MGVSEPLGARATLGAPARSAGSFRHQLAPETTRPMTAVRPERVARAQRARRSASGPALPYLNRELSWLDYNARVLHEATDERNPLLERARFLAILRFFCACSSLPRIL